MDKVQIEFETKERDRVYTDDEIKAIWKAASQLNSVEGAYIKLLILLAPRKTALAKMQVSHLDNAEAPTLWTTPHELTKSKKRAKRKRVYFTPLPLFAQRELKPLLPKEGADTNLIFPGKGAPIWPGSPLIKKLVKAGAPDDFNFHAVRHTLATWLQTKGHSEDEVALVLNHAKGGVTVGYMKGYPLDLKLALLTEWADHVKRLVTPLRLVEQPESA
jgi:integrase